MNNYLFYIVAHQFEHLYDWKNQLTDENGAFAKISWATPSAPKPNKGFSGRKQFKFYDATENTFERLNYSKVYKALYKSDFVSSYRSLDPDEDFAETFAHLAIFKSLDTKLEFIEPKSGQEVDIAQRISSGKLSEKVSFINQFLEEDSIIYP